MINEYRKQLIISGIHDGLVAEEEELAAFKSIKRAKKKDGSPFKQLGRNYPGITIKILNGSGDVVLKCQKRTRWLSKCYSKEDFGVDELEQLIANKIETLEKNVASYKKQLSVAEKAFAKVDRAAAKLKAIIDSYQNIVPDPFYGGLVNGLKEYASICIDRKRF